MDDLGPAAGTMPAMPVSREKSFAEPSGRRPRRRPKGSRNKATLALEAVLEGAAEELTRLLITKALAGDWAALRFCVGRLLPVRRDRPVAFDLPEIESAGDLVKAGQAVVAACAGGILSPGEATEVMGLVTSVRALIESGELETRLIELEKRQLAHAAKTSREEAPPRGRRALPPARAAGPRRVGCKSPVFNSPPATPAGHHKLQEISLILGDRGGAPVTAASRRPIRGPPTHQASMSVTRRINRAGMKQVREISLRSRLASLHARSMSLVDPGY